MRAPGFSFAHQVLRWLRAAGIATRHGQGANPQGNSGFSGVPSRRPAAFGLKPATIYAHHPSKEHILAEPCRIGHEEQNRSVRAAVLNSGADPRDQIVAYVRAHVGMYTGFPMLAVVSTIKLWVHPRQLRRA